MTTPSTGSGQAVREQVRAALSHCAKAYRDADAISALAALDAELAGMETTKETRTSLFAVVDTKGEEKCP